MLDKQLHEELIKKYRWAGKIRFLCFLLLFLFLLLMKASGGYSYLNMYLCTLIIVESLFNQPYRFILNRVNLYHLQFYQMVIDIIVISWVLYYLGGIQAPVVSIAYYIIILWAGVVSGSSAVFFAVSASCILFSLVAAGEHFGILLRVVYLYRTIDNGYFFSLMLGNIAFMFAFGYFSARSSNLIKLLQRKRQEDSLRYTHRLQATGYLMSETAHDIQGNLAGIKAGVQVLQSLRSHSGEEKKFLDSIGDFEKKCAILVQRLAKFSLQPKKEFVPVNVHTIIEDALELTFPLVRYSQMSIEKEFDQNIPFIIADKDQMQEVFVAIILNSLDTVSGKPKGGQLSIVTKCLADEGLAEVIFSDTGIGLKPDQLRQIGEPFFSAKHPAGGSGLGLATAYDIVAGQNGKIDLKSREGEGTTVAIKLPIVKSTMVT